MSLALSLAMNIASYNDYAHVIRYRYPALAVAKELSR